MPADQQPPSPRTAKKAAMFTLGIVAFIIVTIFVGFNLQHAKDQKTGHTDPAGMPKSSTDLQAKPQQGK
jgi:hypothetical protein